MVEIKKVNKRIEELRKELNLSQEQFAVKLGFDPKRGRSTVNNWEQGVVQIKSDDLTKIASTFGRSADWLLGLTDHPTVKENMKIAIKTTGLTEKAIQNAKMIDSPILSDLLENDQFLSLLQDIENLQGVDAYLDSLLDMTDDKKVLETSMAYNFVRVVRFELRDSFGQLVEEIVPTKGTLARAQEKLNETGLLSATDEFKAKKWRVTDGERS